MKIRTLSLLLACLVALGLASCKQTPKEFVSTVTNPMPLKLGDPFMLHASDGRYYMYGTSLEDGFECMVSDDLVNWESCGQIYKGGDSTQWNVNCFWAPEVYERNGKYYMFYSSNWRENPTGELENFRIGVAVSDSPSGPFTDLMNRPLFDPGYPIIDANVYFDDESGRCFLYFSRCCYKNPVESEIADKAREDGLFQEVEESWVYGVELKSDFSGVIGEPLLLLMPPKELDDVQAEWESRSVTSGEVNRRWTEGSYLFRHDNTYYIMYSANSYAGSHYAVGYATSQSPLGPFQKAINNPVLQENVTTGGTVMGTGHNMVITMPDGELYTVYHGRMNNNPGERVVLMDHIRITEDGTLTIYGPTVTPQQIVVKTE